MAVTEDSMRMVALLFVGPTLTLSGVRVYERGRG
jgi:hypothetical protein